VARSHDQREELRDAVSRVTCVSCVPELDLHREFLRERAKLVRQHERLRLR
jgi:hypothetical protein